MTHLLLLRQPTAFALLLLLLRFVAHGGGDGLHKAQHSKTPSSGGRARAPRGPSHSGLHTLSAASRRLKEHSGFEPKFQDLHASLPPASWAKSGVLHNDTGSHTPRQSSMAALIRKMNQPPERMPGGSILPVSRCVLCQARCRSLLLQVGPHSLVVAHARTHHHHPNKLDRVPSLLGDLGHSQHCDRGRHPVAPGVNPALRF